MAYIANRADQDLVRNSRGISEKFGYPPTDPRQRMIIEIEWND